MSAATEIIDPHPHRPTPSLRVVGTSANSPSTSRGDRPVARTAVGPVARTAVGPVAPPGRCRLCEGFGYLDERESVECSCGVLARRRMARLDEVFGFGPALQSPRPSNLIKIDGQRRAQAALGQFIARPGWLYLHGPAGDGKTTLLAAAINELRATGAEAIFAVVPELLDYLRSRFGAADPRAFESAWEQLRGCPVLGLDDLGTEAGTPWADERLYLLFNWRYRLRLPTIVTSNYPPEALRDARLASRLKDAALGEVVHCGAEDIRAFER